VEGVLDCVGVTDGVPELVTNPDTVRVTLDKVEGEGARDPVDLTESVAGL
jgi:hypothetical protein